MRHISAALLLLSLGGAACSSARMDDREPDRLFRYGEYDKAAARFAEGVKRQEPNGDDLLLYLLDWGLSLHQAGKYKESNQAFLRAESIADIKDYTSLSDEAATLLTSDNIKDYKGENFEKVLINCYLAMNYAAMGATEEAIVEARKVNQKLYRMVNEGGRPYEQNAFARYLSAVLYESGGDWNDAYIDYQKVFELKPDFQNLGRDLWRMAWMLHMSDGMEKWDRQFHLTAEDHEAAKRLDPRRKQGEIVILYENGISPKKHPHPNFYSIPVFRPRFNPVHAARVTVDGVDYGHTQLLFDIERTAIQNLDDKYTAIITKKIAGIVAKEVVSHQIGKNTHPLIGLGAKLFFYISDQADVRSWNLLPRDLQVHRITVAPGTHTVRIEPIGESSKSKEVTVRVAAGQKVFVGSRYAP